MICIFVTTDFYAKDIGRRDLVALPGGLCTGAEPVLTQFEQGL